MLRFVTSFDEAQRSIRTFLMEGIRKDEAQLARLESAWKQSSMRNLDHYLDRVVYHEFRGLVIIDDAKDELFRVLAKINANISVLQLKAFESDAGERMFQFDTLYDEFEESDESYLSESRTATLEERVARRAARKLRLADCDTVIVPAHEDGFQEAFLGRNEWEAIRIGAAMKDRIQFIAAYRVAPVQAVTHLAKVKDIKPYKDTGKYQVIFDGAAEEIKPVKLKDRQFPPRVPVYTQRTKLLTATTLDEALI
jgi:hypothetical protein